MKIVFISNYFNHHQKPISDELYQLAKGEYTFVEMASMPEFRKHLGYSELDASYVVKYSLANADEIAKAAKGDEKAIDSLRTSLA